MKTKLVAISKPVDDIQFMNSEELMSFVARVSNPKNQLNVETAPKLLAYCIKHGHWSVFEHSFMTIEIETSRAIAAQILRHKSFNFQELSQRYQSVSEFEIYEARRQDIKNKQNSINDMSEEDKKWFLEAQEELQHSAQCYYEEALNRGVAKEQARFLLPLSTKTTLYMTGNVRSWIHYINARTHESTQLEHRQIAQEIKLIFVKNYPNCAQALGWI